MSKNLRRIVAIGLMLSSFLTMLVAGIYELPTLFLIGITGYVLSFPIAHYLLKKY